MILAHNYQAPEIQDVADHVGDSLALSRLAAASTASVIVFAGVYFMAETAKILAPDRTVLIPEPRAGCSLADTITAQQVRDWKAEHPGAAVVAYVNTSAEVKAESDLCCTSANAAQVVASIPGHREVLFLPDQFLGAYVRRVTGRANMHIWLGECHVHAGISPDGLRRKAAAEPAAELFIHPECGCSTAALWQAGEGDLPAGRTRVLSTGGMLDAARATTATAVLVATETGMLHQLRRANPAVRWEPVNPDAVCRYMKMTTPAALLRCLRDGVHEVTVAPGVAHRARQAVQAMITAGGRAAGRGPPAGGPVRAGPIRAGPVRGASREGSTVTGTELRRLPRSPVRWGLDADVVVVGTGAAGLATALTAAAHGRRVLLLSKDGIGGGATPLAQGGLAAAIGPEDSPDLHRRDTLDAGAGLCDPAAVATLVADAPGEIARLVSRGARLERAALNLEGGHSRRRIVSAGGDAIGREVHRVLRAALLASRVQVLTRCVALDALAGDRGPVGGVLAGFAADDGVLRVGAVTAPAVVLATGGFGQAYATTTNPAGLTGDGLALAARAGAELRDVEFVQFHPTVLWQDSARGQCPLITEALRGAGAVLVDAAAGRSCPAATRSATWPRGMSWRRPCSSGWTRETARAAISGWTPPRWAVPCWSGISPRWPACAGPGGSTRPPSRSRSPPARTTPAAASGPAWTGGPRSPGSTPSGKPPRPASTEPTASRPTP